MGKRIAIVYLLTVFLAITIFFNIAPAKAFSVDITPETLNVCSNGNYLTAYVEQEVLFEDHFQEASWTAQNWHTVGSGFWCVEGDQYSGEGLGDPRSISLAGNSISPIEAYNFALDVKVATLVFGSYDPYGGYDNGGIIAFRYMDVWHMAALVFHSNRIVLMIEQGEQYAWYGQWMYPTDGFIPHEIRIVANGDNYQVYVDDMSTPKIDVIFPLQGVGDGEGLGSGIGLWVYSGGHAHFDDFVLKDHFDDATIDVSTLKIWHSSGTPPSLAYIASALPDPVLIGDYDGDCLKDTMVKFERATIAAYLLNHGITCGEIELVVTGKANNVDFAGSDTIRILAKGRAKVSS